MSKYQEIQREINDLIAELKHYRDDGNYAEHHRVEYQIATLKKAVKYIDLINNKKEEEND